MHFLILLLLFLLGKLLPVKYSIFLPLNPTIILFPIKPYTFSLKSLFTHFLCVRCPFSAHSQQSYNKCEIFQRKTSESYRGRPSRGRSAATSWPQLVLERHRCEWGATNTTLRSNWARDTAVGSSRECRSCGPTWEWRSRWSTCASSEAAAWTCSKKKLPSTAASTTSMWQSCSRPSRPHTTITSFSSTVPTAVWASTSRRRGSWLRAMLWK